MAKKIRITDDEIIKLIKPDLERCEAYAEEHSDLRVKAYKLYRFQEPKVQREGFASVVDSVVWNTCEWLKANIVPIFTGDFLTLVSENESTGENVKNYIRYLLFRKQNGKRIVKDFVHDTLLGFFGIFKICYHEDYDIETEEYERLTLEEFDALIADPNVTPTRFTEVQEYDQTEIDPMTGMGTYFDGVEDVKVVRKRVKFAGPKTSVVPPWEFLYSPGYAQVQDCPFVAHKVKRTLDDIRKGERAGKYRKGVWEKLKDKIDNSREPIEATGELAEMWGVDDLSAPDDVGVDSAITGDERGLRIAQNEVWLYECYLNMDLDKDGLLEPCIVTMCEDIILHDPKENPYGKPPFVLGYAYKEPHKMEGACLPLLLEDEQKQMTNLRRLTVDAAAESTYRNVVTNNAQMAQQWNTRTIGDAIVGNPDSFKEVAVNSPSQFILRAYEGEQNHVENKTGVSRLNQGLDPSSVGKTATGISKVMSASQQRMRYVAENIAEAFEELVRQYIEILRIYPPEDDMRAIGADVVISPDDLRGEFDIRIDIGSAPQERQQTAMILDQHIQLLMQALLPSGLAEPKHLVRTILKKYKLLEVNADGLMPTEADLAAKQQQSDPMAQADQLIKRRMAEGVDVNQIGRELVGIVAEQMNGRDQQGQPGQAPGGGGGGGAGPAAAGQPGVPGGGGPLPASPLG